MLEQAKNHENRCADWLTAQNINGWIDNHKKDMDTSQGSFVSIVFCIAMFL